MQGSIILHIFSLLKGFDFLFFREDWGSRTFIQFSKHVLRLRTITGLIIYLEADMEYSGFKSCLCHCLQPGVT